MTGSQDLVQAREDSENDDSQHGPSVLRQISNGSQEMIESTAKPKTSSLVERSSSQLNQGSSALEEDQLPTSFQEHSPLLSSRLPSSTSSENEKRVAQKRKRSQPNEGTSKKWKSGLDGIGYTAGLLKLCPEVAPYAIMDAAASGTLPEGTVEGGKQLGDVAEHGEFPSK